MDARYWHRRARLVALRYNLGWWLAAFLDLAAAAAALFACVVLVLRRAGWVLETPWIALVGGLLLCAMVAWLRTRRRFFSICDGLIRLDAQLGLHNRLVSAAAGVGDYPPPRPAGDGWRWRWPRLLLPPLGAALLVGAAVWVPIAQVRADAQIEPPSAWAQVESWVEQLEKEGIADQAALESLREKLESLRERPAEEWYSQNSLEAGDNLRDQAADAIRALQRDLQSSATLLAAAQELGSQMSAADLASVQRGLEKALHGLELGRLPADAKTLADLKAVDLKNLRTLTPDQLRKLQQRLREGAGVCKQCVGPGVADKYMTAFGGREPGSGAGVARGPGSVPLELNPRRTELGTSATEALPAAGMENALPGEAVGMAAGEHEVDTAAFQGATAAGAASSAGSGGEAVWRDTLTPDEREMLKRFFK